MEEVTAEAKLAETGGDSPLTVGVPRAGIDEALQEDMEADLVLDVVRTNGAQEVKRVLVALDLDTLRRLADEEGDQVMVAIDPETLAKAFDEVEAHGLREMGATLGIVVAAVGGGAGIAQAYPADGATPAGGAAVVSPQDPGASGEYVPFQSDFPTVQAEVLVVGTGGPGDLRPVAAPIPEAGMPRAMPADYAASEQQMPRAMPSDYAAAAVDEGGATLRRDPGAMPSGAATTQAAQQTPEATATDDSNLPVAGVIVGGALLSIAAAFFLLRRREPTNVQPA